MGVYRRTLAWVSTDDPLERFEKPGSKAFFFEKKKQKTFYPLAIRINPAAEP
jgi:hypothetical protein